MRAKDIDWSVKSFYVLPTYTCPFCETKIGGAGWVVQTFSGKKILVCFGCGEDDGKPPKRKGKHMTRSNRP
jgi:hypothetical protein